MSWIVPYLPSIIGILIASGTTIGVAIYVRRKNRTQAGKDVFGLFIREMLGKLPERDVKQFYITTMPHIRVAVERVKLFLSRIDQSSIERLLHEYEKIPAEQLDSTQEASWMPDLSEAMESKYQHPREVVKKYLDEFSKYES